MLELGILLTNGRPFIREGRRGLASPRQHLYKNTWIRSQWKRREMSRHSGSEGFELHSPLQDVQMPEQISSSDGPNECQIGWEQVVDH